MTYDATGWERVPFNGSYPPRPDTRLPHRNTSRKHGPRCRPSDPRVGCVCGEDERSSLDAEAREMGFRSYKALEDAMGPERMDALVRSHHPGICPNPRRCSTCRD